MRQAQVCKTFIRRFDSDPRLHLNPPKSNHFQAFSSRGPVRRKPQKTAKSGRTRRFRQAFGQARPEIRQTFLAPANLHLRVQEVMPLCARRSSGVRAVRRCVSGVADPRPNKSGLTAH